VKVYAIGYRKQILKSVTRKHPQAWALGQTTLRQVGLGNARGLDPFDAESGKDLGVEIREYFIPDFTNWKDYGSFKREFGKLLGALKSEE
jgi:hypothetical protein